MGILMPRDLQLRPATSGWCHASGNEQARTVNIFRTINHRPKIDRNYSHGITLPAVTGHVELLNVSFAYPSRPEIPVLGRFSLNIPAGKNCCWRSVRPWSLTDWPDKSQQTCCSTQLEERARCSSAYPAMNWWTQNPKKYRGRIVYESRKVDKENQ